MNITQSKLPADGSLVARISKVASLYRVASLSSLWLAIICLLVIIFGSVSKQGLPAFIVLGVFLLCGYYLVRQFAVCLSRAAWVSAHAVERNMWLKKGIWSNDLYADPDSQDVVLTVANMTKIKNAKQALSASSKAATESSRRQRSEVLVKSDYFLDGGAVIFSDSETIVGMVSKSEAIPGIRFFGRTFRNAGPTQDMIRAESHLWVLLVFPGTFAFLMKDSLPYSLFPQAFVAITVLLAMVFLFDLPMKWMLSACEKDIVTGNSERFFEHRINRLAVMCLRYGKNAEADLANTILMHKLSGKEASHLASKALSEYLATENRNSQHSSPPIRAVLLLVSAISFVAIANSQSRVHAAPYLAAFTGLKSYDLKLDDIHGTLKGEVVAINGGKDGQGVRIRMNGTALTRGIIDHPHLTLTSTASGNQSQTEQALLEKDASGDWVGVCKNIPLHAVAPFSPLDAYQNQLTLLIKADILKNGKGDVVLEVSPLDPSQTSTAQFTKQVNAENLYKPAPSVVTKKIPFVLYPKSTVYVAKYLTDSFTAFTNRTGPGLPEVLAYYDRELTSQRWKTRGMRVKNGTSHVSFSATKGKQTLTGEAWGYDEYCKIDFEVIFYD